MNKCPNCGSKNVDILSSSVRNGMTNQFYKETHGICFDCKCVGPKTRGNDEEECKKAAVMLWNKNKDRILEHHKNEIEYMKTRVKIPRSGKPRREKRR